jgi:hypothetical protein
MKLFLKKFYLHQQALVKTSLNQREFPASEGGGIYKIYLIHSAAFSFAKLEDTSPKDTQAKAKCSVSPYGIP